MLTSCAGDAEPAALTLDLGLVDGSAHQRTLRPAAPSSESRTWRTLVLLDLEAHPPHDAIQRITARAEPTLAREVQFSLLDPALPSPERLAETMARLTAWTAEGRGGEARLLDTHRPGAFAVGSFSPGPPTPVTGPSPPLRVALRAYRPPRLAHVVLEKGAPAFVSAPGVRGAVAARAGPWRASGDWWDAAWSREEWDVALASGGVFRVFLDRLREAWYVDGELDYARSALTKAHGFARASSRPPCSHHGIPSGAPRGRIIRPGASVC